MRTAKKPDLNAPRFRTKRISVLTANTFKAFKQKHPEYADMELKQFKEIIMTFNQKVADGMLENRNGVELPEGLGFIFMGACPKPKQKNPDYGTSNSTGQIVTHKNWDSDNKLLKIFYTNHNTKYPFRNKQVWAFKAVKQLRKAASEAFKKNYTMYIEVDPTAKISGMFDRHRKKEFIKNLKPVVPEGYDEFKL